MTYMYVVTKQQNCIQVENDKSLSPEEKSKLKNQNYSTYILVCIVLFIIFGSYMYSQKKTIQYGGGYDLVKFLFN